MAEGKSNLHLYKELANLGSKYQFMELLQQKTLQ